MGPNLISFVKNCPRDLFRASRTCFSAVLPFARSRLLTLHVSAPKKKGIVRTTPWLSKNASKSWKLRIKRNKCLQPDTCYLNLLIIVVSIVFLRHAVIKGQALPFQTDVRVWLECRSQCFQREWQKHKITMNINERKEGRHTQLP